MVQKVTLGITAYSIGPFVQFHKFPLPDFFPGFQDSFSALLIVCLFFPAIHIEGI
jgi:hypothetical protein